MAKKRKSKKRNPKRTRHAKAKRARTARPKKNPPRKKRAAPKRAKRNKRKVPRRNPAAAGHFTVVFPSAGVAREFIESFPSKAVRAAYRHELQPVAHGASFKSWSMSRAMADNAATAITQRLAYQAGRRRRRFIPPKLRIVARA